MTSRDTTSKQSRGKTGQDPLLEAMRLIDRAIDEHDPDQQVALAQAALELSPDCTEAYQILADNASSVEEAISLLEAAVDAARRQIGEADFEKFAGEFFEFVETRPYMQARLNLAECLSSAGRMDEAIEHFQEMLQLNPGDNQGCRVRLASALLMTGRREELHDLLAKFPDDFLVDLHYTRALLAFQEQGDTEEARGFLLDAAKKNPHVPAYLAGTKPLPKDFPPFVAPGEESEAVHYTGEYLLAWRETPGALPWLRSTLKVQQPAPPPRKSAPWSRVKRALNELPQSDAVWEVDLVPIEVESGKAWAFLIVDTVAQRPLHIDFTEDRPRDKDIFQSLTQAMRKPDDEEPARPQEIRLIRKTWQKKWSSKLGQIETGCSLVEQLDEIPDIIGEIRSKIEEQQEEDVDQLPVDNEQLASIPQQIGEVWIATARKLPAWIQIGDDLCRPNLLLVFDETNDLILATDVIAEAPTAGWLWTGLQNAFSRPAAGEPRRPGVVHVLAEQDGGVGAQLEALGIRCVIGEDNPKIDELVADLAERIGGGPVRSLLKSPGVTTERLAGFYAAAKEFYQSSPWRRVPGDTILRIEADAFGSNLWYGVVMGQMGMHLGLALYEDLELVRDLISEQISEEESGRRTSALTLSFGEAFDISPLDYDAIQKHNWPIASEEAYPSVMRINPGLAVRTPLAWEIELLEGSLRALPSFLEGGTESKTVTVKVAGRQLDFQVSSVK